MSGKPRHGPCLAPHLHPRRPDATQLTWYIAQRFARRRVVAWTCADHDGPSYELCHSGGQWFIEVTRGDRSKPTILHTQTWPEGEARQIWTALLFGLVR